MHSCRRDLHDSRSAPRSLIKPCSSDLPRAMIRMMLGMLVLLYGAALAAAAPVSVTVGVRLPQAKSDEIERLFWAVSDPDSEHYQQYLGLEQVRQLRAVDADDATEVREWLHTMGCTRVYFSRAGDSVTAECPSKPDAGLSRRSQELVDYVHVHTSKGGGRAAGRPTSLLEFPTPNSGTPVRQRKFYSLPESQMGTNATNTQMVWGCGTFGVNKTELGIYYDKYCPDCVLDKVQFDTEHHGTEPGDNFDEGTLDTTYISSFGKGVKTIVSNTNISMATEEGEAQGEATVWFMEHLADRPAVPFVLSLSLGSLSFGACDQLCTLLAASTTHTYSECHSYMQRQRQVCLYASRRQQERINTAFKLLGLRGVTVLGASGDGGPHWSFGPFPESNMFPIGKALNQIGCQHMSPLFPANSPYILSVGGVSWVDNDPSQPIAWNQHEGSTGGGFSDEWPMPVYFPPPMHVPARVCQLYQTQSVAQYFAEVAGQPGVPPTSQYNGSNRAYPDVSAFMDGVPLCMAGGNLRNICGGTSASTPTVAGILSLLNDVRLNRGLKTLGIWKLSAAFPGEAFVDVHASANTSTGCRTFFPAAKGWDPQTGWGYPHWPGLLAHLGNDDQL